MREAKLVSPLRGETVSRAQRVTLIVFGDEKALNAVLTHLRSLVGTVGVFHKCKTDVKVIQETYGTSVVVAPGKEARDVT